MTFVGGKICKMKYLSKLYIACCAIVLPLMNSLRQMDAHNLYVNSFMKSIKNVISKLSSTHAERIYKTTNEKNVNEKEKKYEKNIKNKTS